MQADSDLRSLAALLRGFVAALSAAALCLAPVPAKATVVDASQAEDAYQAGEYRAALGGFQAAVEQFRTASKDSSDYRIYREAAYLYDRLCDCSFTTRDWNNLKLYLDGLLVVGISERNLTQTQFAGALDTGVASATARYLAERVDQAVRLNSIFQLKRSIGLVLFETNGQGAGHEEAVAQYQRLAQLMHEVLALEDGLYSLDTDALDSKIDSFDAVYEAIDKVADVEKLWAKHPPESKADVAAKD